MKPVAKGNVQFTVKEIGKSVFVVTDQWNNDSVEAGPFYTAKDAVDALVDLIASSGTAIMRPSMVKGT